ARTAETQREAAAKAATDALFVDNDATKGIKPVTNQAAIDAAQAKVDLVTDATVKAELQAQIDKAQAELDARTAETQREAAAKAAINDLFIGNNPANNIKDTTTQAAIEAAQAKVNAVTDPTAKAELQAQIDKAQAQINTRIPVNGTVAKYTVGDLNITGNYSGPATALSVDINNKRYYGGTIANGTFKFYVGDKNLKPSDVVTLNLYDANKQIQKSITVPVFEALKITIADYKIGDNYLTATYNYPEITKIGIVVDGTKYWGGDVKDGTAKFFAADKIKNANADVTMNFYDASNNLIASKKVTIATASAEISTANYTVGATNITGTFAGDIRKIAVSINGTKYYGGSLTTNGTYKFYVLDKKIKATDTVIMYGYDANNGLLSEKTVTIAE
ncbi:immunoglobulin-like domain-containing protein, partial [Listeria booriae]